VRKIFQYLSFLPERGSTFSERVDRLHFSILLVTFVVAAGIGVVGLVFLVRYRARTPEALTPKVVAPRWLEGIFVIVPLSAFLTWFYLGFHQFVWVKSEAPPDAMDVYVTAKQWMWKFSYPEGPNAIGVLYIPAGRPVRVLITSRDVIHSFFVPAFRLKQDAVPGRYTEIWFQADAPGHYEILCAEYCGLNHSQMRGEVVALPPAEFQRWMDEQRRGQAGREDLALVRTDPRWPEDDLRRQGERVAAREGCFKCHSVDGSPHIGPTFLDLYRRVETMTTGERVVATEAYLTESMMDPNLRVVEGFKPVMPSYLGRLTPAETAALLELIKSLHTERLDPVPAQEPVYEPAR
jgi:cytochrome c oxidase subunit II